MAPPTGPGSPPGSPPAAATPTPAAATPTPAAATPPAPPSLSTRTTEDLLDVEQRLRRIQQLLNDIDQERIKNDNEITELGLKKIVEYEKFLDLELRKREIQKEEYEREIELFELEQKKARLAGDAAAEAEATANLAAAQADLLRSVESVKEFAKEVESLKPAFELGTEAAKKMFSALKIGENSFSRVFDKVDNFQGSLTGFGKAFGSNFIKEIGNTGKLITTTVLSESFNLMNEMNQVFADTKKEFGVEYGEKLNDVFMKSERSLRQYGISAAETNAINKSLNGTFSDFIDMIPEERDNLIKNAAVMQKLGISNQEYSESIKFMEFSMDESREAAQENIAELVEFGRKNGVEAKTTIANFGKVRSYISQFGDNWQKTFNRMSLISRKTGLDMQELISIAQGFDTFDTAATSVGQLNALLGGPFLNTVEMIRTEDPSEQIMKIKEAFDSAGKSVNSMSKYELKGFAEAIPGINGDVEKMRTVLNKLDSGMLSSADAITEALEGPSDEQKKVEEQLKASQSIAESLSIITKSFALMTPLLESLNPFFQTMASAVASLGDAFPKLTYGLGRTISFLYKIFNVAARGVPILGTIISFVSAIDRFSKGDYVGAFGEAVVGVASVIPGLGVAASTATTSLKVAAGVSGGLLAYDTYGAVTAEDEPAVDDFIYRGNGINGSITPINSKDQFLGLKDGGPAQAGLKEVMDGISKDRVSYETSILTQNKTENDFVRTSVSNNNVSNNRANTSNNNIAPNINLTVMLEGRELRAFVKQVIADNLNPLK